MKVAQKRNAVQEGLFYFRKDIYKGRIVIMKALNNVFTVIKVHECILVLIKTNNVILS